MRMQAGSERGVTLIEASIVLAVVGILAAVMAPSINIYIDQARAARAREDVKTIGDAINEFMTDNAERQFLKNGSNGASDQVPPTRLDSDRVNILVSDGDIPTRGNLVTGETLWTQTVNGTTIDTLSNHLIENTPGELTNSRWRNPSDIAITPGGNNIDFARAESSGFNAPYAWRGAYLRGPVESDPWGNRYAVNVAFLDAAPTNSLAGSITAGCNVGDFPRMDVFALSAGPDEEIDTKICQDGATPGDDDFIYLVSSNAK